MANYEELGQMGFALAMQLLGNREDAADAVQDALHRLISRRGSFDAARAASLVLENRSQSQPGPAPPATGSAA